MLRNGAKEKSGQVEHEARAGVTAGSERPLDPACPGSNRNARSVTFVGCVESGPPETMALLLVERLRRWGGACAGAPLVAGTPRFGPPLRRETRRRCDELGAMYHRVRPRRKYSWNGYLNKPHALITAERYATSSHIVWLDSDILVTRALDDLIDDSQADFAACPSDKNIGTSGPDDRHEPYWREVCRVFGLSLDDLPWVTTHREGQRIRAYFNSGVFFYPNGVGFGERFLEGCTKLLEARVASHESGIFFTDQVVLGLTMLGLGLRWRVLPGEFNYPVTSKQLHQYDPSKVQEARLLHYHDMLWPSHWPAFMERLKEDKPDLCDWLRVRGSLRNNAPLPWRGNSRILRTYRNWRLKRYEAQCAHF